MAPEPARQARRARRRSTATATGLVAVGLVVAVILSGTVDNGPGPAPPLTAAERAALPRHLGANEAEASQVVDGSIEARLAALRGSRSSSTSGPPGARTAGRSSRSFNS